MQSIKIKGKDYIQVHERVAELRRNPLYKTLTIETEIVEKNYSELTGDIFKHKKDDNDKIISSTKDGVKVSKVLSPKLL